MKDIFNRKQQQLIDGWFHFELHANVGSKKMEPEVMLFNPQNAGQAMTVNHASGRSSLTAVSDDARNRKAMKEARNPRHRGAPSPPPMSYDSDSDGW